MYKIHDNINEEILFFITKHSCETEVYNKLSYYEDNNIICECKNVSPNEYVIFRKENRNEQR